MVFQHPVTIACQEKTEETIEELSKTEMIYVACELCGIEPPRNSDGDVIHPDNYRGDVKKRVFRELLMQHPDVKRTGENPPGTDDESSEKSSRGSGILGK